MKKNLEPIFIAGPTASGKSELAFRLAKKVDGVIVSADSMQIYKGLDIGTAKESLLSQSEVQHKMIDIIATSDEFSVSDFARLAKEYISEIQNQGKNPIICGGTGLYFQSLLYPMTFATTSRNEKLRNSLEMDLEKFGAEYLHNKLNELDIKSAKVLHINDTKRVIRALEIVLSTGKTRDELSDEVIEPNVIMVGLNTDRAILYDKINRRVDTMFENGLIDEVYSVGSFDYQSMQAIGYKEFASFTPTVLDEKFILLDDEIELVAEKIKKNTRNYAKRQLTWFRRYDFMKWFECGNYDEAIKYVEKQLVNRLVD